MNECPKPTERFSSRVQDYRKYRPSYPPELLELLERECGLTPTSVVADVGSGTGKLSELFLDIGNRVYGIEPNRAMREAGEELLQDRPAFVSVNATAEATTLPEASVDLVTAGQAFHWFDPARAKQEFARILRPGGWVVLVWNERRTDTPFLAAYETLIRAHAGDYGAVSHKNVGLDSIRAFFAPNAVNTANFGNSQHLDFEGFLGRASSSSYMPDRRQPGYDRTVADLRSLFEAHQLSGKVTINYTTKLYYGQLSR